MDEMSPKLQNQIAQFQQLQQQLQSVSAARSSGWKPSSRRCEMTIDELNKSAEDVRSTRTSAPC